MKNSKGYYARAVYNALQEPAYEKTVLFVEPYNAPVHGDCKAILEKMLLDERFCDWRFIWAVPDTINYDDAKSEQDPRITITIIDSHDFVDALERAQQIVTATYLPYYYIKREEQLVYGCLPDYYFDLSKGITKGRVALLRTLSNLDVLFASEFIKTCVTKWYPAGLPFSIIEGHSPRILLQPTSNAPIVVSLTSGIVGNRFSALEAKYKECKYLAVQYGKDICFRIEERLYQAYQIENEPEILSHLVGELTAFCQVAKNAEVVITNRSINALDCATLNIPCIFISPTHLFPEYLLHIETPHMQIAKNWTDAMDMLKTFLHNPKRGYMPDDADAGTQKLLNLLCGCEAIVKPEPNPTVKKELWVVSGDAPMGFWKMMEHYHSQNDISVLARSDNDGLLFDGTRTLDLSKKIYCRSGTCLRLRDKFGEPMVLDIAREWARMFGGQHFDQVYFWDKDQHFWNIMCLNTPFDNLKLLSRKDFTMQLGNKVANRRISNSKPNCNPEPDWLMINDKKYYKIGSADNNNYYLKAKEGAFKNLNVVFLGKYDEMYSERYANITNDNDTTFVFIDPQKHLEKSELRQKENVYWIPKMLFPIELIKRAVTVHQYDSHILYDDTLKILY